jgi:hypothetical protein
MISTVWKSTGRVTFGLAQRLVATLTPRAPSRLVIAAGLVSDLLQPRRDPVLENALLRQQLIVARRSVKRPRVRSAEKLTLLGLCRLLPRWRNALLRDQARNHHSLAAGGFSSCVAMAFEVLRQRSPRPARDDRPDPSNGLGERAVGS